MVFNTGLGDKEEINTIMPLFNDNDFDLGPLISSKLYHCLMTFNVLENIDTIFD